MVGLPPMPMSPMPMSPMPMSPMPMSPMPMSPQTTVSQPTNPTVYQWYTQASPWGFGTGGVPGWLPVSTSPHLPQMYPMYPNASPNFQTSPPVNPPIVSPTPESSKTFLSPSTSPGPGPSLPPPYIQPQGSNKSQDLSRNKAIDVVDQGNVQPVNAEMSALSL
jgi:hypothetical protein